MSKLALSRKIFLAAQSKLTNGLSLGVIMADLL
jgi:hypothetical protein